jgi:hypothetical protein
LAARLVGVLAAPLPVAEVDLLPASCQAIANEQKKVLASQVAVVCFPHFP